MRSCYADNVWPASLPGFEEHLAVNIGEMFAHVLGGRAEATLHRVVNAQAGSERHHRYAIVHFHANPLGRCAAPTGRRAKTSPRASGSARACARSASSRRRTDERRPHRSNTSFGGRGGLQVVPRMSGQGSQPSGIPSPSRSRARGRPGVQAPLPFGPGTAQTGFAKA